MKRTSIPPTVAVVALLAAVGGVALAAQDKYTLKVPGGLAFSEFRGYDDWQTVAVSQNGSLIETILGNPAMIKAYKAGIPGNGKPFPDGSKIVKLLWTTKTITAPPFSASTPDTVAGPLTRVEVIEKDGKRFADTHGWGYGDFDYDATSDTFKPGTTADTPPQGHDTKCGAACHTLAASKDYIFTGYAKR